jgi:zinc transport system substrate-binding protein
MRGFIIEKNQKTMYSTLILLCIISACLTGCVENTATEGIGVLVTIVPQVEMVEFIGGEYIDVTVMVPPGESPHSFEPTPEQMKKVAQAMAYFKVGSGVEFEVVHMDTILEQNSDLQVFDCSEDVSVISFDQHYGEEDYHEEEHDHEQEEEEEHDYDNEEDDEHDHDHEGTDPHIWTSPVNFKKMAEVVYNGLVEIDPDHQEEYYTNYQAYISKLDNLNTNVSSRLQQYGDKSFMVYHPAWGYFGDTYNLKMIAIEDEGKQPGPAGIDAIIKQAQDENITVIFVAPQFDTSSAETIADEIGGNVVFANPLMSNYEVTITKLAEDMVTGFENS